MRRFLLAASTVLLLAGSGHRGRLESGFADSGGVKIHYVTAGKGPLIVLIHGFPDFWYTWARPVPECPSTIRSSPSTRGADNLSDKPRESRTTSDKLVGDVAAVIKHFGQDKAIVVGHDWGGLVAWSLAMTRPELVERLVILNLPHPRGLYRELASNPAQQKASQYARRQKPDAGAKIKPEMLAFWVKDDEARKVYVEAFPLLVRRGDAQLLQGQLSARALPG